MNNKLLSEIINFRMHSDRLCLHRKGISLRSDCSLCWEEFFNNWLRKNGQLTPKQIKDILTESDFWKGQWNLLQDHLHKNFVDRIEAEVHLEQFKGQRQHLIEAAKNLLEACYQADAREELAEEVDGSLLDAVRDALIENSDSDSAKK